MKCPASLIALLMVGICTTMAVAQRVDHRAKAAWEDKGLIYGWYVPDEYGGWRWYPAGKGQKPDVAGQLEAFSQRLYRVDLLTGLPTPSMPFAFRVGLVDGRLTAGDLKLLTRHTTLVALDLGQAKLAEGALVELANCKKLQFLRLQGDDVTNKSIK